MLKKLLFVVLAAIVFLLVVGLFLPTTYYVERSVVINASPAQIHTYVNDLKRWEEWEPWGETDPSVKVVPGLTSVGVGASQSWESENGDGQLTFTASDPNKGVNYSVLFDGQFASRAAIKYVAAENSAGTKVTWSLAGGEDAPKVIGGYFALAMDGMLGPMYEKGLGKLKKAVESP